MIQIVGVVSFSMGKNYIWFGLMQGMKKAMITAMVAMVARSATSRLSSCSNRSCCGPWLWLSLQLSQQALDTGLEMDHVLSPLLPK